jgi:hypothetical protein
MKTPALLLALFASAVFATPAFAQQPGNAASQKPASQKAAGQQGATNAADTEASDASVAEPSVVVTLDKPGTYTVLKSHIVRIATEPLEGAAVDVKVEGALKRIRSVTVLKLTPGEDGPFTGPGREEHEFDTPEAGAATITVTRNQEGGGQPKKEVYEITIR